MSNGFLTVEDINSNFLDFINEYYTVDTSLIDDSKGISHVQYDFVYVSRSENDGEYKFYFEIDNSLWCGGYYITDVDDNYLNAYAVYTNDRMIVTTSEAEIKLHLQMCNYVKLPTFRIFETTFIPVSNPIINANGKSLNEDHFLIRYYDVVDKVEKTYNGMLNVGVNEIDYELSVYVNFVKTNVLFNFEGVGVSGKLNHMKLGVAADYLPGGSMVDSDRDSRLNIEVLHGDTVLPVVYDSNVEDYCFDLDLTDKLDTNSVKLKVKVISNEYVNNSELDIVIPCEYVSISNETDLISNLASGIKVLKLGADIGLTSNILVSSDVIVYGEDNKLTLNNHSIVINEGVKLILNNAELNIGSPAIIQKENTILELTKVKFTNNIAADYNNLGSCIFCDVDLESLSVDSDFTTRINDCTFINNHSAIFHGGQLTVDNCKYLNNDLTYVDKDNPAFLYQTDGDAEITNSIFDIDYQDNTLCENQINIGFAQALVRCGIDATINNATHESLQEDNKLPFFENYRNQSHVFAKYYYPQIETCVFTSPVTDKETESICYCVSGTDWVYKTNAVVTRADWQNENTINNIDWEGI